MAKKTKSPKRPKPYRTTKRFGILNPWGDFWTPQTFDTEALAQKYIEDFWRGREDLPKFKVVKARVTVSAA